MNRKELLEQVASKIKAFSFTFAQNPLQYFYEEDLRSTLHYLLSELTQDTLILPSNEWTEAFNKKIAVNPFKAEYPQEDRKKSTYSPFFGAAKFDIAYVENAGNIKNHYRFPISIAIELKLRINNYNPSTLIQDFNKLKLYKPITNFLGLALLFDQTPNLNHRSQDKFIEAYSKQYNFSPLPINDLIFADNHIYAVHIFLIQDFPQLLLTKTPSSVYNSID